MRSNAYGPLLWALNYESLFGGTSYCEQTYEDSELGAPYWETIGSTLEKWAPKACKLMAFLVRIPN